MKNDFFMPIFILSLLCLFISGLLAVGNSLTLPVIMEAARQRSELARKEVMPHADGFVPLDIDDLPVTITEAYGTTNNAGFVFTVTTIGYGGEILIMCAIDPDGKIIKTVTLAETETRGIATAVFALEEKYMGKDKNLNGIDGISGATITFTAYKNAILDAFIAFEAVKEARF